MATPLKLNNTLSRKKEIFEPLEAGFVGMYVCGPTVYNPVHLGNCRTFTSFDLIYRYLMYKGYRVRYVRNITDVGHLTDSGEDKMAKEARISKLEPMEVAAKYANDFHDMMRIFNNLNPSIEPQASGHIIEQIEMVQQIIDNGYGYEVNGSVYFDVAAYEKDMEAKGDNAPHRYGALSGRKIDELLSETRELNSQAEKKSPSDFAIWMKAKPEDLQKWKSPWGVGFPGWHLECSAMSTKYLGETFDIHGGGNDLKFPHHENEIAQNVGCCHRGGARYWLHTNMLLMNGRKMSKSDGNTVTPDQLFTGDSPHLTKGYSPMAIRFFMLQTHYSSTMDLTDEALQAAEKGYLRLMEAIRTLGKLEVSGKAQNETVGKELAEGMAAAFAEMDDDFNTPKALARVFEIVTKINALAGGQLSTDEVNPATLDRLKTDLHALIFDVLGLQDEAAGGSNAHTKALDGVMDVLLDIRQQARTDKNWGLSDQIRDALSEAGIKVKDGKEGATWSV
ncbi:cysteine--tRNA ligase [Lewinellaceae bacterium SD302]|nr:cysteine--tRNA ligase [Lewinellaceae bacterium SD302]